MFKWIRRSKEKKLAEKKAWADRVERNRIYHEEALQRCKVGEHEWEYDSEIQGDGDPNIEGYIEIIRATCRICGKSETTIESYDKSDSE